MLRTPLRAKKDAAKSGAGTGDLGLKGPGAEAKTIKEIDEALADYKKKRDKRIKASKEEVPAKELVISLFHKHAETLQDGKGTLRYNYHDEDDDQIKNVYIEAAKEKIKFGKQDNAEE